MHFPSCSSHCPRDPRAAFTLIELLTVIAIIGILAAIIIPTVGRVRASARMTADTSSLRELGRASALYASENKGFFPNERRPDGTLLPALSTSFPNNLYAKLNPYFAAAKTGSQYGYSANPFWYAKNAKAPEGTPAPPTSGCYINFAFNPNIWRAQWGARMSSPPSPSRIVIAGETNDSAGDGGSDLDPAATPSFAGDVATKYRISQPGDQALYLWADFHVSALKGNQNFTVNPSIWRWWSLPVTP